MLLCIMNATLTTTIRTAAVTAVSAPKLARADSEAVGIIGADVQGTINAETLCITIPSIKKIKIYDIMPAACEQFKKIFEEKIGVEIQSVKKVVIDSDIVVTAT